MYSLVYSLVYGFLRVMYTLYTLSVNIPILLNKKDRYTNISGGVYLYDYTYHTSTDKKYTLKPYMNEGNCYTVGVN